MENKANYTIVGLFVVIATIGIFAVAFWMAGGSDSNLYVKYNIYFEESVNGLSTGSAVRYRGVTVGSVDDIVIDEEDQDRIKVTIRAKAETPITIDTRAKLKFQGITGLSFVELVGDSKGRAIVKKPKQDFPVIESDTSELTKLFEVTPDLIASVNEIATRLNLVLSVENIKATSAILKNVETITAAAGGEGDNINKLVTESTRTVREFRKSAENFNKASAKLAEMSDSIAEIANDSKDNIINFSDSGFRSIVKFFSESRKTAEDLGDMARELKENPSSLLYPEAEKKNEGNE